MRPLTQHRCASLPSDNFYGTPKPPAEPSPAAPPLNVSEALLPGARPSSQGKRKRNQSVSNMEQRASLEPPEEEEEESPVVNGNGVAITPGTVDFRERRISDRLCLCECELHMFSVTLYNWTHKGTVMSSLLSLSTVSFWLQRSSLSPIVSPSLLLSLLSRHWPLSLFLFIPPLSPLSSSPLPSSSFWPLLLFS